MQPSAPPRLSATVIIGPLRNRARRAIDALAGQRGAERMEIVVGDLASDSHPRLPVETRAQVQYIDMPSEWSWGRARAEAVRVARGDVVAFVEDHCYAQQGWAEALMEAHEGPWAAVGYAFIDANRPSYGSRGCLMADYGLWAVPARGGPSRLLPYGNVSYKRSALLALGPRLEEALTPDFNALQILRRKGLPTYIEARAVAAHENYPNPLQIVRAKYEFCRMLAARRVAANDWGWGRRILQALAPPIASPSFQVGRLARSLWGRPSLVPLFLAVLPVVLFSTLGGAAGETLGYLLGEGSSVRGLRYWELDAVRELEG